MKAKSKTKNKTEDKIETDAKTEAEAKNEALSFSFKGHFDAKVWKLINEIEESVLLTLTKDTLIAKGIDKAMICAFEYRMRVADANLEKDFVEFRVDASILYKIFQLLDGYLEIKCENERLWISADNTTYLVPLLDMRDDDAESEKEILENTKQLSWDISFELTEDEVADIIRKTEWFTDAIDFEIKDGMLTISAENETIRVEIKRDVGLDGNVNVKKTRFPLSEIKRVLTVINKNIPRMLKFYIKEDYPLKIEALDGSLALLIAPRIVNE